VSELQRKKAWAAEAAQKIAATFVTVEDRDFLIHTTLPKGSRELATLRASLAGLKKLLAGIVGARTNATIWPGKLQFVLLRSEPEYERFAQMVDGEASAKNPDGAYTKDGHTALWKPDSPLLAELLGESALENFEGSDRWVGWWLRDGVAVLLLASSPEGQKQETYKRSFFLAADLLKAEGDNYKVFNLLETRDYKSSSADRNRALALTLVDYLVKKNRTGLGSLIKALKSDKAPAPARSPAEQDSFHLSYISFQSQAIESAFGMQVSALDGRWKEYVHQMAQKLKEQEEAAGEKEKEKEKEKGGKKPR
jgi:hypothetical protein